MVKKKLAAIFHQIKKHSSGISLLSAAIVLFRGFHIDSVYLWKIMMVSSALIIADILRKTVFPYLDLSEQVVKEKNSAAAIFAGLFYLAIILGLTTGL